MTLAAGDPEMRVRELIDLYSDPAACVAELLCDRHEPVRRAYRLIADDLTSRDLSYGELRAESERFANALTSLGVGPGDRVATLMGKSWHYLVALMGIWRVGAVHVPLFTAFAPPAIAFRVERCRAKLVLCDEGQRGKLAGLDRGTGPGAWQVVTTGSASEGAHSFDALLASAPKGFTPAAVGGDAPLIHIFTSGTTGDPKGVIVPVKALAAFRIYAEYGLGVIAESDEFWCAADPGWAYGLYFGILATFTTGVSSVLYTAGFNPEATFAILAQEKITNFTAAPTVYRSLRSSSLAPTAPLYLRCASSAGEPLTPEVNVWAQAALGTTVHDHYGQTEAGMLINNHHHPAVRSPMKDGSMGRPMPGWSAVVLREAADEVAETGKVGRVAMDLERSPLAWFKGYDGSTAAGDKTTANGRWYLTGDVGRMDVDGDFFFSARDDDVIIMAGYRIGPFEVESVMARHPDIAECAVIAVPDEVRGEVIEAYVVLRDGAAPDADLEKQIQQWVKRGYAAHAYPRKVHFADALPKTPSGKIQRFVLKQQRLDELRIAAT